MVSALIVPLLVAALGAAPPSQQPELRPGAAAPPLAGLEPLRGEVPAGFEPGKIVLIEFFAHW